MDGPTILGDVTARRRCFLSSIIGTGGTWTDTDHQVRITQVNGKWQLDGNIPSDPFTGAHAGASAVCVDIPEGYEISTRSVSSTNAGPSSVNAGYDTGGHGCGLTGIRGKFNQSSWSDGVMLDWPSPAPGNWTLNVSNNKAGWATCVH